ncbi:uncharacterized protein LOC117653365 [Thrips palmi]|uniref:Uncharacterized protein LOC117653365 n=1 Tax=Thrips palmi TaxID=161013 RepID=A0A6P9ABN6_THRPL|nr:uncharacterized protein LOC117653365 [Thrips palmi]
MPTLDRDEPAFLAECESVLSSAPSPGASGDFGKDSRLSSYGSTSTSSTTSLPGSKPPAPPATTLPKDLQDPEQWALLGAVLPPPGGWAKSSIPPGLTAAEVIPLAQDPFWCRLRACFMALFWVIMVALLACVVVIVVNDPKPCGVPRTPVLPPQRSLNVSLPLAAMPVLQVMAASRY